MTNSDTAMTNRAEAFCATDQLDAISPSPRLASNSDDDDASVLAEQIVLEHGKYWRKLTVYIGFGTVLASIGLSAFSLANLNASSILPFAIRTDISAQAALGALAVLATVIVALQIAVRVEVRRDANVDDAAKVIARQRALEFIAFVCGFAATAVGLSGTFRAIQNVNEGAILHSFAPFLGGLLLAALAADASTASDAGINNSIGKLKREQEARAIILALASATEPTAWQRAVGWAGPFAVATVAAIATYWALLIPFSVGVDFTVFVVVSSAFVLLVATLVASFCVYLRLHQKWKLLVATQLAITALLVVLAITFTLAALDGATDEARASLIAVAAVIFAGTVGIPVLFVALSSMPNGVLTTFAKWEMGNRLRVLTGEEKPEKRRRTRGGRGLLLIITALLPPVGLPFAQYQLRRSEAPDAYLDFVVCIGYSSLTVYAGVVVGFVATTVESWS